MAPVDWDDDGDLDLVLGANGGGIFVRINEGSAKRAAYATESIEVKPGGDSYRTSHSMPVVADWDGDGLWDLLTGSSKGDVYWIRNIGEKGKPRFAAPQAIVKQRNDRGSSADPSWPGMRTQVAVADWNGDGHLDLLIGDYQSGKDRSSRHGWVWLMERRVETTAQERL